MLKEGCSGIWALTKRLHGAEPYLRSSLCLIYSTNSAHFLEPRGHYHVHNILPLVPILNQINSVYIFPSYFFKVHFSTVLPSAAVFSKWFLPLVFSSKTLAFCLSHTCHMTRPFSTSTYPLRQTHMTWFVMEWRMKWCGSQKHLIWFWHFGAYKSLVFSGKKILFVSSVPHLPLFYSFHTYISFPPVSFIPLLFFFVCLSAAPCVLLPEITVKILLLPNGVLAVFLLVFPAYRSWKLLMCWHDFMHSSADD